MNERRFIVIAVGLLVILSLATVVWAQVSTNFDLSWHVFGSGGGQSESTNYRVQDTLGQWTGGTSFSAQHQVQAGFWYGVVLAPAPPPQPSYVYLPLVLRNYVTYFEGPWEVEPNDSAPLANGPLRSGQPYFGDHDGPVDDKDFFSFTKASGGTVTVNVVNLASTAQVTLYDQNGVTSIGFAGGPPFTIICPGTNCPGSADAAGTYYIRVLTPSGYGTEPYTLQVTFP